MDIRERIAQANQQAVACIIDSDPYWVDIRPAGECVEGLEDHMILHSGPPVDYDDMVMLHKRGMVSAMLFEGWAKDEKEAVEIIRSGEIRIDSALNHNTVGAGTGIITKSVAMNVIEDRRNHTTAATFPAEGPFQGGFCGWGLYSPEIAENLRYMREVLFPPLREMLAKEGGIAIKPILAESMQMGDENHTRQTAADLLFDKQVLPRLFEMDLPKEQIMRTVKYIVETPRFFHCYGQGASRAAAIAADGTEYSTMVTALAGNGVEFGIKIASLPGQWFTAPAPMMKGRYTSTQYTEKDQLPWLGDSCVVETAGLGGFAAAAGAGCLGFMVWNLHPAKVMMGDTGSMFLGGIVTAVGIGTGTEFVMVICCAVYIWEALSVMIQMTYYKLTKGKRLFKMTPIHHSFEMSGWKEGKIVMVFSAIELFACVVGVLLQYFGN